MTRCAVVGAGAWGTALADLLARNGHDVVLCTKFFVANDVKFSSDDALALITGLWLFTVKPREYIENPALFVLES